jgi:hypothetical protein
MKIKEIREAVENEIRSHTACFGKDGPALPSLMRILKKCKPCKHRWGRMAKPPKFRVYTGCFECGIQRRKPRAR